MKMKAFIFCLCLASTVFAYSGGSGEPNDPYQIGTAGDLLALAAETNDYNKPFILTADINLAPYNFTTAVIAPDTNNSTGDFQGVQFSGVFDGNGHKIINLTIDTNGIGNNYLGLFGDVNNGQIKNLALENVTIADGNNSQYLGGLAGYNRGTISNCHSTGDVSGGDDTYSLGGLVGKNEGAISNCHSAGNVSGGDSASLIGGLVGYDGGTISNCHSASTVAGGNDSSSLGGLVGWEYYGNVSECNSTGTVTGGNNSQWVGGFIGGNYGNIRKCFSSGNVESGNESSGIGGLAGHNGSDGNISNCYSTGAVTGGTDSSGLGGLVGDNYLDSHISNCYSTGSVAGGSGSEELGGLVGYNAGGGIINNCYFLTSSGPANGNGTPLTDANMKHQASFIGWDFAGETANGTDDIWKMCEGVDYPKFDWQYIPSITFPLPDAALAGNVVLTVYISEDGCTDVLFYLREPNGSEGTSIGYEDLAADFNRTSGKWEYELDTTLVSNGNYVILAKAIYECNFIAFSELVSVTVSNNLPPPVGNLTVTLGPAAAVSAGAKWRVDSGDWQSSGTTVTDLPVGAHTVNYQSITGWNTPADQNVTINNGETTDVTGTYMRQTSPLGVTKCTITAGSKDNSDKISFSGTMGATTDDFNDANTVEVTINSNDIVNPCDINFPIDGNTFKKGKYSYSKTVDGVRKSFTYDLKTRKFAFAASNVDLSGLSCPLTVQIVIGSYYAGEVNETIVNGPKTPIPMKLMMGVKDVLRVDKCTVKHGKDPNTDQLSVKGAFVVRDMDVNMAEEELVAALGEQTFTLPAGSFKAGKGKFTCSKVPVAEGGTAAATFNFNLCSFILTITKSPDITASPGVVNFGVAFADYNEVEQITLPP